MVVLCGEAKGRSLPPMSFNDMISGRSSPSRNMFHAHRKGQVIPMEMIVIVLGICFSVCNTVKTALDCFETLLFIQKQLRQDKGQKKENPYRKGLVLFHMISVEGKRT